LLFSPFPDSETIVKRVEPARSTRPFEALSEDEARNEEGEREEEEGEEDEDGEGEGESEERVDCCVRSVEMQEKEKEKRNGNWNVTGKGNWFEGGVPEDGACSGTPLLGGCVCVGGCGSGCVGGVRGRVREVHAVSGCVSGGRGLEFGLQRPEPARLRESATHSNSPSATLLESAKVSGCQGVKVLTVGLGRQYKSGNREWLEQGLNK
jgi:hypothetical protein